MSKGYKLYRARIKDTGYPMDGYEAILGLWDYDKTSYHLNGWDKEDDEVFIQTFYASEVKDFGLEQPYEEYRKEFLETNGDNLEGVFCIEFNQAEIIEELKEE